MLVPKFPLFVHLQNMEVLIIYGIYTHHVAVFCGLYLLSSDVSKSISFDVGFIGNYIKGNLVV